MSELSRSATSRQHEEAWAKIHDLLAAGHWARAREIFDQAVSSARALKNPAPQVPAMVTSVVAGQNVEADGPRFNLRQEIRGLCDERLAGYSNPAVAGPLAAPPCIECDLIGPSSCPEHGTRTPSAIPSAEALQHIKIWKPYDDRPTITLEIPGRGFWSYYPANDDPDGGEFMLDFKEHFGIKGVDRG